MAQVGALIRDRIWPPAPITTSFADKTAVVTGANTGVGYESALKYVELGASTVILAVRSMNKGERAKELIEKKTQRRDVLQVWELDMDSHQSIDDFAKRVDRELDRLDVVVLNAGVVSKRFTLLAQGWEKMLQINTLSTALLALLLTPKLKASGIASSPAHMNIVSSTGHLAAKVKPAERSQRLHSYNTEEGFSTLGQYNFSKLAMMWITRELAKRCLGPDGSPLVIINDTCPGACRTEAFRDYSNPIESLLIPIVQIFLFRTAEQGARTLVGATALGEESHGRWWVSDSYATPSHYITDSEGKEMAQDMWNEVLGILRADVPRVDDIIAGLVPKP
ncbi:hypothetical protein MMC07_002575 [Pseudocyphellaria aurata]|nr:hypothetical protein [Pseudocyphellaria aurata]